MSTIVYSNLKCWDGKVSQNVFNKLVDAVQSITLDNGVGYKVLRSPSGTTIQTQGSGAGANICPFTVTLAPTSGDPTSLTVTVRPGSVNSFVPTNVFDTFTVDASGTFYVKAAVETDGQNVTSFSIAVDSSTPDAQTATASSLPTTFDVLIAIINDGKVYRIINCGSITLVPFEAFITSTASPAGPGELNYIPYYVWQVSTV